MPILFPLSIYSRLRFSYFFMWLLLLGVTEDSEACSITFMLTAPLAAIPKSMSSELNPCQGLIPFRQFNLCWQRNIPWSVFWSYWVFHPPKSWNGANKVFPSTFSHCFFCLIIFQSSLYILFPVQPSMSFLVPQDRDWHLYCCPSLSKNNSNIQAVNSLGIHSFLDKKQAWWSLAYTLQL